MNIDIPPVVKNLLIINVLFFVAMLVFDQMGIRLIDILGAHYFASPKFQIWQPITYMFMHANSGHIFSNMFALFVFGSHLERHWGQKRFLNFYMITGLGALAFQWIVQAIEVYQITGSLVNDLDTIKFSSQVAFENFKDIYFGSMVGASGAIFGIITAFGLLYPNVEMMIMFVPVPIKAKFLVIGYIFIEIFSGLYRMPGDSVAHFAHLGGALIGYILVKLWRNKNTFYKYYE